MGSSGVTNLEEILRYIEKQEVDVEIYFQGGLNLVGKISLVGSDFVEIEVRILGGKQRTICPFSSIAYLSAEYEGVERMSDVVGR